MRTFYDFRDRDHKDPNKFPLQGRVIFKKKNWWMLWIHLDPLNKEQSLRGFIVAPRTIYIYQPYLAKGFWDALKHFLKSDPNRTWIAGGGV